MKYILIYCPDAKAREAISHHVIDVANYQIIIAETEALVVSLALHNEIHLLVLFDPAHAKSLIDLKDFLRQKRRKMRVRLLPDSGGNLMMGWRQVITDALKPSKKREPRGPRTRPRFKWNLND